MGPLLKEKIDLRSTMECKSFEIREVDGSEAEGGGGKKKSSVVEKMKEIEEARNARRAKIEEK